MHDPLEQDSLAPGRLHVVPQPPQLLNVLSWRSQPFALLPSQLPKPLAQVPRVHEPVLQLSLALFRLQLVPHPLQLVRVLSRASHPFAGFPSQSPKPGLQVLTEQVPPPQPPVPLAMLHAMPQPLQFVVVSREVSQPLPEIPSQSPRSGAQLDSSQAPVMHVGVPPERLHGTPQPPQLVSVRRLVSQPLAASPSQSSQPVAQAVIRHDPVEHSPLA
ncbi:MAG: hypothetical protein ACI9KE_006440 [Polyangiales bacterium]